ncbi:MAG: phage holin family protein [Bacteroidota bacterium]
MSTKEKQKHTSEQGTREDPAKIERIAGHTAGLVEDLKSWLELKIEFVLLDVKEEMKATGMQAAYQVGFFAVLLVAGLFGLIALAFGLGTWLGNPAWGFLAVTGLLVLVAFIVKWVGKRKGTAKEAATYDLRVDDAPPKLSGDGAPEPLAGQPPQQLKPLKTSELTTDNHAKDQ